MYFTCQSTVIYVSSLPWFDFFPFLVMRRTALYHIQPNILGSSLIPPSLPGSPFSSPRAPTIGWVIVSQVADKVNPVITGDPRDLWRPLKTCLDVETTLPTNQPQFSILSKMQCIHLKMCHKRALIEVCLCTCVHSAVCVCVHVWSVCAYCLRLSLKISREWSRHRDQHSDNQNFEFQNFHQITISLNWGWYSQFRAWGMTAGDLRVNRIPQSQCFIADCSKHDRS